MSRSVILVVAALLPMFLASKCHAQDEPLDYGASAFAAGLEHLPYFTPRIMAYSESSYDRRGLDVDLPSPGLGNPYRTYLGVDAHGDRIFLDVKGPGCVYRLFMSEMSRRENGRLKIYFDGSATPTINEKVSDLCQAHVKGFPCPLVHIRNQAGTGAPFTSQNNDVPLPFAKGIKITCDDLGSDLYQNIQYHLFPQGTPVKTWTPEQDLTRALEMENHLGVDPKPTVGNTVMAGKIDLAAGGSAALPEINGQQEIRSIRLNLPGFAATSGQSRTAAGIAFAKQSQFKAAIEPANDGVRLKRLYSAMPGMSCCGKVLVDGQDAGTWKVTTPDPTGPRDQLWHESTYFVPSAFTKGKTTILISIVNTDAGKVWNEYAYSIYSNYTNAKLLVQDREESDKKTKAKGYRLSDTLELGDAKSVAAHAYTCDGKTWSGTTTSRYLARSADYLSLLKDIKLNISWDHETTPSVSARLCDFFAQSESGLDDTDHAEIGRAIPVGLDEDNRLYCFFPMPFAKLARIELTSTRNQATPVIQYEIQYKKFNDDFSKVGYFKAHAIHERKESTDTSCFTLLDVPGRGKVVGVSANMNGLFDYLEGDERIYVDGMKTAVICGSGKEDFYGGSYYFWGGPASLPLSGCTYNRKWGYDSEMGKGFRDNRPFPCSAYRFMLNDFVPFRSGVKFEFEHGSRVQVPPNHSEEESTYLTFYYHKPTPAMTRTDSLLPADAASRTKHQYGEQGKSPVTKTGNWDRTGFYGPEQLTCDGRMMARDAANAFTVNVNPINAGVMLRRLMWYADANQEAQVEVDGQAVGAWYDAGRNEQKETEKKPMLWRETQFLIPEQFTRGKSHLKITLKIISPAWNEYKYEVFSMDKH